MRKPAQGFTGLLAAIAFLFSISESPAFAQTTWGSLHFGMTLPQARAALAGKIVSERPMAAAGTLMIVRPVKFGSASGEPRLAFDPAGQLVKITWDFSIAADGCFTKYDSKLNARRFVHVAEIGNKYPERYGKPQSESGSWPTADQLYDHFVSRKTSEEFAADRTWHADDQVIRTSLHIHCDNVALLVEYEPDGKK